MNMLQLTYLTRESWNLRLQNGWIVADRGKEQANKYSTTPERLSNQK